MKKITTLLILFTFFIFLLSTFQNVFAASMTQGEYAVKLAEKLCLGENLTADAAIADLNNVGVMPLQGWKTGDPINWIIAGEVLNACRRACNDNTFSSLTCCKEHALVSDKCCDEAIDLVSALNEELGLLPPVPPTLPPNPPASVSE